MIENLTGIVFMGIMAFAAMLLPLFASKASKRSMFAALVRQTVVAIGLGLLFTLGAGLQSPPGYPVFLIPVSILVALIAAHFGWRAIMTMESAENG